MFGRGRGPAVPSDLALAAMLADGVIGYDLPAGDDAGLRQLMSRLAWVLATVPQRPGTVGAVFDRAERLLLTGSRETVDAIGLGLLEDLQTLLTHPDYVLLDPDEVTAALGPRCEEAWVRIAASWSAAPSSGRAVPQMDDEVLRSHVLPMLRCMPDGRVVSLADLTAAETDGTVRGIDLTRLDLRRRR